MTWVDSFTFRHLPPFDITPHDISCLEAHRVPFSDHMSEVMIKTRPTVSVEYSPNHYIIQIAFRPMIPFEARFQYLASVLHMSWTTLVSFYSPDFNSIEIYTLTWSSQKSHVTKAKDAPSKPFLIGGLYVCEVTCQAMTVNPTHFERESKALWGSDSHPATFCFFLMAVQHKKNCTNSFPKWCFIQRYSGVGLFREIQ